MLQPLGPFSPTWLDTWELCPRKFAFVKFDGEPKPPSSASAQLGTEVHDQLAKYLQFRKPLDLTTEAGYIALAGIHLLPAPKSEGMRVEMPFSFVYEGVEFKGQKDLAVPGLLVDHKTTGDLKWRKQLEELFNDFQWAIYTYDELRIQNRRSIDTRWVYYRTKGGPKAEVTEIKNVTYAHIKPTLHRALKVVEEIKLCHSAGLTALQLPPNPNACEAFGGCPWRERCNLSPNAKVLAIMAQSNAIQDKDSLLADLRARQNGAAPVNPPESVNVPASLPNLWHPSWGRWVVPTDPAYAQAQAEGAQPAAQQPPPQQQYVAPAAPPPVVQAPAPGTAAEPVKRKPGRPPGSKNKAAAEAAANVLHPSTQPTGAPPAPAGFQYTAQGHLVPIMQAPAPQPAAPVAQPQPQYVAPPVAVVAAAAEPMARLMAATKKFADAKRLEREATAELEAIAAGH